MSIELIIGGARSGKSSLAERRAAESGLAVAYIATATIGDGEMAQRIAHHRERRPAHWRTVEEPLHLADALRSEAAPGRLLLVDCLTLWLSNLLLGPGLEPERRRLLEALGDLPGRVLTDVPVSMGSAQVSGVRVGVGLVGSAPDEALLGQSFLNKFEITLAERKMTLRPKTN